MPDILNRLLGHNAWTTRQLVQHARALTAEQYVQRFDLGPGSVHDTLRHIISVMFGWADEIAGRPRRPSLGSDGEGPIRSVDELLGLLDDAATDLEKTAAMIVNDRRMEWIWATDLAGERCP